MKSIKRFITLTGGVCFMMGALATATVVADDVSANDKAPVVVQLGSVAMAPAMTKVSQNAEISQNTKAPMITDQTTSPSLANIWDKYQCFIVLSGRCL